VHVDGHAWLLKFSKRALESSSKGRSVAAPAKAVGTTKLLIRNVPFEASKKEMRELLSTFGQIKSMRLPKKLTGDHRGFCFVDFLTEQEAKHAFESLASTHLYGRHLVIEWAKDDDSLGSLREKMTRQFLVREHGAFKKAKIDMNDRVSHGPDRNDDDDDDDDRESSYE
jgi:multiple RNA-binding domain-containing protein 1